MLTPKQLQAIPKPLTDIYSQLSDFVLHDIAMRISEAAKITDTAEYQIYRARALGMSQEEITAEIARINGEAQEKIAELIAQAAERSDEFDRQMLGVGSTANTEQLQKLINAQTELTNGLCTNLTGTLGFAQKTADGRMIYGSATDFLRKQMDMAQMKVMTRVCDYNTAIRQACNMLAESGLRTVYYASGHSDRIEVAVRRALMTSVSQLTQKISEQNAAEFGADGWEISAHMGARPSHAVYQGRQYPNSQYETIVLPLITDYNCRHSAYPIILGVTKPSYTEEQLKQLDPPPFTYEGRQYTAYEAQQQMRKMERVMRKQRDKCVTADAVGDKDTFTAASIRLRRQKDIYEDFCKAAGTYTEYERTFVADYDRHLAGKTGAVTRAQNKFKNAQVTLNQTPPLTNGGNGGIIKRDYQCELAQELGKSHFDNMHDILEKCNSSDLREVWNKYEADIGVANISENNREHCDWSPKIHIDLSSNSTGSSWQKPYQTVFHESGHAIDMAAGRKIAKESLCKPSNLFSATYQNGLFPQTIKDEMGELVSAREKLIKDEFKKGLLDYGRLHDLGCVSDLEYDIFQRTGVWAGKPLKYSKSMAYKSIENEIRKLSSFEKANLSDIMEGATSEKIKIGWGHGNSYWENGDWTLATEAFAEMMDATVANPESLTTIQKYLPKSYEVFLKMLKDLK